jgi:hypothetical protein
VQQEAIVCQDRQVVNPVQQGQLVSKDLVFQCSAVLVFTVFHLKGPARFVLLEATARQDQPIQQFAHGARIAHSSRIAVLSALLALTVQEDSQPLFFAIKDFTKTRRDKDLV